MSYRYASMLATGIKAHVTRVHRMIVGLISHSTFTVGESIIKNNKKYTVIEAVKRNNGLYELSILEVSPLYTVSKLDRNTWYLWDKSNPSTPTPHYYRTVRGVNKKLYSIVKQQNK